MRLNLCNFELLKPGECQCTRCKRKVRAENPATLHAACPMGCNHLGDRGPRVKVVCDGKDAFATSYACAARGRCLPKYQPKGNNLKAWRERKPESDIYALCHGCPMFCAAERNECKGPAADLIPVV
jgi:hypothetical protein